MSSFRRFSWFFEAYGPVASGLLTFALLWLARDTLLPLMAEDKISITNLFSAIFGWASIQTGCVFAIYGFVAGKNDGFIGEVRKTRSMKRYGTYIMRAIISGFILTITSMPLIVWKYTITKNDYYLFSIIGIWFSIFVWAFLSFARVAYIFGILVRVEDAARIDAG